MSKPSGRAVTKSSAPAAATAASTSASVAPARPKRTFSRMLDGEEHRLLQHHRGVLPDAAAGQVHGVVAVDAQATLDRVDAAQQQLQQGRLAGAARADDADALARVHDEVCAAQHRVPGHVLHRDPLEPHLPDGALQRPGPRPVRQRGALLQGVGDPLPDATAREIRPTCFARSRSGLKAVLR